MYTSRGQEHRAGSWAHSLGLRVCHGQGAVFLLSISPPLAEAPTLPQSLPASHNQPESCLFTIPHQRQAPWGPAFGYCITSTQISIYHTQEPHTTVSDSCFSQGPEPSSVSSCAGGERPLPCLFLQYWSGEYRGNPLLAHCWRPPPPDTHTQELRTLSPLLEGECLGKVRRWGHFVFSKTQHV